MKSTSRWDFCNNFCNFRRVQLRYCDCVSFCVFGGNMTTDDWLPLSTEKPRSRQRDYCSIYHFLFEEILKHQREVTGMNKRPVWFMESMRFNSCGFRIFAVSALKELLTIGFGNAEHSICIGMWQLLDIRRWVITLN